MTHQSMHLLALRLIVGAASLSLPSLVLQLKAELTANPGFQVYGDSMEA